MDAPPPAGLQEDENDLAKYVEILRKEWWKIALFSLLVGAMAAAYMYTLPDTYRATAVIKPESSGSNQVGAGISALASLGLPLPISIASRSEDLEVLLKSDDLAIRVFRKYDFWPILLKDSYDPGTKSRKVGWLDRLFGGKAKPLSDWDAAREVRLRMRAVFDRKTGVMNVSFESLSAEGSATILRSYLEEAKSRMQEEVLTRANRNKQFIQGEITRTVDPLTRERLFALYGSEVEREMLARNREQFGFTIIDSPKVPDQKAGPRRSLFAQMAAILAIFVGYLYFVLRWKR